jgi:hypothetical protein
VLSSDPKLLVGLDGGVRVHSERLMPSLLTLEIELDSPARGGLMVGLSSSTTAH